MTTTITKALEREHFPILDDSTYLVSHSMGAAPLGAKAALESYWNEWAAEGPEAWEKWLPRIAETADGIGRLIGAPNGSVFLGPNVSSFQAALATCIPLQGERNEVLYESLQFPSLTYVWSEWKRFGAVIKTVELVRRPHHSDRTHRRSDHRAHRDRGAVARVLRFGSHCRRSNDSAPVSRSRGALVRQRVSNDRHLSVRCHRMGSRYRHRRFA